MDFLSCLVAVAWCEWIDSTHLFIYCWNDIALHCIPSVAENRLSLHKHNATNNIVPCHNAPYLPQWLFVTDWYLIIDSIVPHNHHRHLFLLYCTVLTYRTVSYLVSTSFYCTKLNCTVLDTLQYCTVSFSTVLNCIVLNCTVLHRIYKNLSRSTHRLIGLLTARPVFLARVKSVGPVYRFE